MEIHMTSHFYDMNSFLYQTDTTFEFAGTTNKLRSCRRP